MGLFRSPVRSFNQSWMCHLQAASQSTIQLLQSRLDLCPLSNDHPIENAKILKDLGRYNDYYYNKPEFIPLRINLSSYSAQYVLNRAQDFNVMWTKGCGHMVGKGGLDCCLSGDTDFHKKQKQVMAKSLYRDQCHSHVKHFYEYITFRLLHEKSCKIAGINQVDITRE